MFKLTQSSTRQATEEHDGVRETDITASVCTVKENTEFPEPVLRKKIAPVKELLLLRVHRKVLKRFVKTTNHVLRAFVVLPLKA